MFDAIKRREKNVNMRYILNEFFKVHLRHHKVNNN